MGVYRTDYLVWGAKIDPAEVDFDAFEAEICGAAGRRFDMIYDGMSGEYAIAGEIIAKSDPHDGMEFHEIGQDCTAWKPEVVAKVREAFPAAGGFSLYLFSHFS